MALLAGVVDGLPDQARRNFVAVRAVAAGAVHLALHDRVGERLHRLATDLLVAVEADLGLGRRAHDGVMGFVDIVAGTAGDFVDGMRAAVPAEADIRVVTFEAHTVLRFDRRRVVSCKRDDRRGRGRLRTGADPGRRGSRDPTVCRASS